MSEVARADPLSVCNARSFNQRPTLSWKLSGLLIEGKNNSGTGVVFWVRLILKRVKLGVSDYWKPNATRHHGSLQLGFSLYLSPGTFLRYYLWYHITVRVR
jgi:hypothetical protein